MSDRGRDTQDHEALRCGPADAPAPRPRRPPRRESSPLLQGHRAGEIHHNGELYRLQATRTGKLILTK